MMRHTIAMLCVYFGCGVHLRLCDACQGNEEEILKVLKTTDPLDRKLLAEAGGYGPGAFPLYARMLGDKAESKYLVLRVIALLSHPEVTGDRTCLIEPVVPHLANPDEATRRCAVILIGQIGGPGEVAPVAALLSDKEWTISLAAAKCLARIGDRRAVDAMNVWLNSGNHRDHSYLRGVVAKLRDELSARLERIAPPPRAVGR